MDYFDLKGLEAYKQYALQQYSADTDAADWVKNTREKLRYLVELLSQQHQVKYDIVYSEKPNGQGGRGRIVFKDYVLVGFAPQIHNIGDHLFIKIEFSNLSDTPVLCVNLDLNFREGKSPYAKDRDSIYNSTYKEFEVDEIFPENWADLVKLIDNEINLLQRRFTKILGKKGAFMNENIVALLEYKKQIILQGPPGTGKTKLAKEIADELITFDFDLNDMALIKPFERLYTLTDKTPFIIEEIDYKNKFFRVKSIQASLSYTVQFDLVLECIIAMGWDQGSAKWNGNGNGQYVVSLAKEISVRKLSEIDREHLKIIQFHPSYTYEDFVRGITAKPNTDGDGILYDAENKILAQFAIKALDNYTLSKEDQTVAAENIEVKTKFERFIDYVQEQIDSDDEHKYSLTEKVYIFDVDVEKRRFKYKGDNWKAHANGLNMNFSEIEKIIRLGATERSQISNNLELASLTKSHATWYLSIIEKYNEFTDINNRKEHILNNVRNSTTPQKYVLIIDEINRANLSSVLGELIYALEYRGEAVDSMYEVDASNKLTLPPNLYIIGTMNTADRSVGHIDYAIRRRFAFVDVLPEDLSEELNGKFASDLFHKVTALFTSDNYQTRSVYLSEEFEPKQVALGHSYFIDKSDEGGDIKTRWSYEIKPILLEYVRDGVLKNTASNKIEEIETTL